MTLLKERMVHIDVLRERVQQLDPERYSVAAILAWVARRAQEATP